MMAPVCSPTEAAAHFNRDVKALGDLGTEGKELLFDLVEDVFTGRTDPGCKAHSACRFKYADGREGTDAVLMPYYHTGPQDLQPAQRTQSWYLDSGDHLLAHVTQGVVFTAPIGRDPLMFLSMSECSCIVGVSDDRIAVAHVSYSERFGLDAALAFFCRMGIPRDRVFGVVSVGEWQEGHSIARAASVADYTALGIPAANIIPFRYFSGPEQQSVDTLAGVLVTANDITLYRLSGNKRSEYRTEYLETMAL